ncbi:MAG: hypothetical protein ACYCQK_10425, partial [Acidiferrobacteraceae bacterium]
MRWSRPARHWIWRTPVVLLLFGFSVRPARAIQTIRIGTLYAGSGPFATSSLSQYRGLTFWVHEVNRAGGLYVKALHKKVPVKLIAYNDRSSPTTA